MIKRSLEPLDGHLKPNRALLVYGARRVGKTTLLNSYLESTPLRYRLAIGDDLPTQQILGSLDLKLLRDYLEGYELLAIDEAQYIPQIGRALKLIVDQIADICVIATGSSSFELAGQIGEPLTGRKLTLTLYPLTQSELLSLHNRFDLSQQLEEYLLYGTYPEAVLAPTRSAKVEVLKEIAGSYLLKDVLAFDRVRSSRKLIDLLRLIAFQVGSEVSASELATQLGVNIRTVQHYLDLLEKAFVLYRLGGFSRNLRKEVTRSSKYYFYDTGIRNAVIAQFNRLNQRSDVGQLWENFMVIERLKQRAYSLDTANPYFWRTYDRQEIDLIEERGEALHAFEFKWSTNKRIKPPKAWRDAYPSSSFSPLTPANYLDLLVPR